MKIKDKNHYILFIENTSSDFFLSETAKVNLIYYKITFNDEEFVKEPKLELHTNLPWYQAFRLLQKKIQLTGLQRKLQKT